MIDLEMLQKATRDLQNLKSKVMLNTERITMSTLTEHHIVHAMANLECAESHLKLAAHYLLHGE